MKKLRSAAAFLLAWLMLSSMFVTAMAAETSKSKTGAFNYQICGSYGDNITYSIENGVLRFSGKGNLEYDKDEGSFISRMYEIVNTVYIGEGITSIGQNVLVNNTLIEHVYLPESLKTIGEFTFNHCTSLEYIEIPYGVETIGRYAFNSCEKLKTVILPETIKSIDENAFLGCKDLVNIYIPSSASLAEDIGVGKYQLHDTVNTFGAVIYAASSSDAKKYADKYSCLTWKEAKLSTVSYSSNGASGSMRSTKVCNGFTYYPRECVYTAPYRKEFKSWSSDGKSYEFGDSLTISSDCVFTASWGELTVGDFAIAYGSYNVELRSMNVIITKSVYSRKYILKGMDIVAPENAYYNKDFHTFLYESTYNSIKNEDYPIILRVSEENGGTVGDCVWDYDFGTNTFTVSGTGDFVRDDSFSEYLDSAENFVVNYGVTGIGNGVIQNSSKLKKVTLADSVRTIGNDCFKACPNLEALTMSHGVETIGENCFTGIKIKKFTIPDSLTQIGDGSFSSLSSLTKLTVGDGLTTLGKDAFSGCDLLTSVAVPRKVTSIGDSSLGFKGDGTKIEGFKITGYSGTEAERYAKQNEFDFESLGGEPSTEVVKRGDVNDDGEVNGIDQGILSRYIAGWDGYKEKITNWTAADINKDGSVDGADSAILRRYVSGWEGYDSYFN